MTVTDQVAYAPWMPGILGELLALLDLQSNWNSYGAPVVSPSSLGYGLALLARTTEPGSLRPAVVPSPSGGFQFEWHENGVDLEVEVLPSGQFSAYFQDRVKQDTREVEGDLEAVYELVRNRIAGHLTRP